MLEILIGTWRAWDDPPHLPVTVVQVLILFFCESTRPMPQNQLSTLAPTFHLLPPFSSELGVTAPCSLTGNELREAKAPNLPSDSRLLPRENALSPLPRSSCAEGLWLA